MCYNIKLSYRRVVNRITTVAAGSTNTLVDSTGNIWAITSGAQITVNGVVDPVTANVIQIAYVNGHIWQDVNKNKV
jgi:hypothetical protein